jgi:ubiquinol oxidase
MVQSSFLFAVAIFGWAAISLSPANAFSVVPSTRSASFVSVSRRQHHHQHQHRHHHHLAASRPASRPSTTTSLYVTTEDQAVVTKPSTTSTAPTNMTTNMTIVTNANGAKQGSSEQQQQQQQETTTMDQGIFDFNKKLIDTVYDIVCLLYPVKGTERDYARFFVLETVARVPYFAYLSVLHLKETFGDRGHGERMRTHYAQADNELHHLLIMEDLGGNSQWLDRTVAQTMAFGYYWYVVVMYLWREDVAYHLSELIEDHAYNTYDKLLKEQADRLKTMPVPSIAHKYYELDNPFLFDLFCTVRDEAGHGDGSENGGFSARRPKLESLYDVFVNIRNDEREHWKTLCNLVQYDDMNAMPASQVRSTEPTTTLLLE